MEPIDMDTSPLEADQMASPIQGTPRTDKPWLFHKGDERAKSAGKKSTKSVGKQNYLGYLTFKASLQRAMSRRSRAERIQIMEQIAEKLIDKALEGSMEAIKEIADRIDGKAMQNSTVTGTVNHVQVFLRDSNDLEKAMLEANKHRFIAPKEVQEDVVDTQ
jgi:hypothetical protein